MKRFYARYVILVPLLILASCGTQRIPGASTGDEKPQVGEIPTFDKFYKTDFSREAASEAEIQLGLLGETPASDSRYLSFKPGYENLWETLQLKGTKISELDFHVNKIVANKGSYQQVAAATGVPWWWVGIVHGLEGSYNFSTHLHNGDSLQRRTVQVPANRPIAGSPPFTWLESAIDAVRFENFHNWKGWEKISVVAYSFETYNGFGYRNKGINSPYLWSFSNAYTSGKYIADGVYSPTAVSAQAGGMAILKRGIERGIFSLGTSTPPPAPVPTPTPAPTPTPVISPFFCPTGFSYSSVSKICLSATEAVGPFSIAMIRKCESFGGGTACEKDRWSLNFYKSIRGTISVCLPGTVMDTKLKMCAEGNDIFGPFTVKQVSDCKLLGGGSPCESNRWHWTLLKI